MYFYIFLFFYSFPTTHIRDQSLERDHELFKQQKAIDLAITDSENKKNNLNLKDTLLRSTDFKRPKKDNGTQTGVWGTLDLNSRILIIFPVFFHFVHRLF